MRASKNYAYLLLYFIAVLILSSVLYLTLISPRQAQDSASPWPEIFTIAIDPACPPYSVSDGTSLRGFDVDIMRAISYEAGIIVKLVPMPWNEAAIALENGEIDGIQGTVITPDRQTRFDFSDPYFSQSTALFVNADDHTTFSLNDLTNKRLAVQEGDVGAELAEQFPVDNIIKVASQEAALQLLLENEVDAVLGDYVTGIHWAQTNKNTTKIKIAGNTFDPQPTALAVAQGNTELLHLYNHGLAAIQTKGTYDKIQRRWFGQVITEAPFLSKNTTVAVIVIAIIASLIGMLFFVWSRSLSKKVEQATADLSLKNEQLLESNANLDQMIGQIVHSFSRIVEARDRYTKYHSDRVAHLSEQLALKAGLCRDATELIYRAGLLHDIGKIGIPENLLNKPAALTAEEYQIIQAHPFRGYTFLQEIPEFTRLGLNDMILQHHERWDGHGYPHKLKGTEIILGARILAIADSWDAMTSNRAYRRALPHHKALAELQHNAGIQFDPELVALFIQYIEEFEPALQAT